MQTMHDETRSGAPVRASSTVVLVRSAPDAPEVFMVKRHERSSFGTAYAFPGGVLEDVDNKVHDACTGMSPLAANRILDVEDGGLDYFSAATRELFEESGVLLGNTTMTAADRSDARTRLNDGSLGWDQFVFSNDLSIQCNELHYFSFWITPVGLPKRYSTRFFLAKIPAGQSASHDGAELTDSCWLPARQILQARRDKSMRVHYPTRKTLERVALFDSTAALCAWANLCSEKGVTCDQPALTPEMLR